jgi:hypothetical protein
MKDLFENPMFRSLVMSWLLRILAVAGSSLVTKGLMTQEQVNAVDLPEVAGAVMVTVSFVYGSYRQFKTRQKLVTSVANPQLSTEAQVEQMIKEGGAASVRTPKTETPQQPPQ